MSTDRRRFLQSVVSLGTGASAAGLLSSCHMSGSTGSGPGSNGAFDTLRIGVPALPSDLDPTRNPGNADVRVLPNIFDTLISADQTNNYKLGPMLATAYKRVDAKTVHVELRKNVTWHDGSSFSADDVVFSINRITSDDPNLSLAYSLLGNLKAKKIDDLTVEISSPTADPVIEQRIACIWGSYMIPKKYIADNTLEHFATNPIGTGPYRVDSSSPDMVVLKRYDGFWGDAPLIETIEYHYYPDTSDRITAFLTGEIEVMAQLPQDQVPVVNQRDGVHDVMKNLENYYMLVFDPVAFPVVADVRVRQALNLAIDRQQLVTSLWNGEAQIPHGPQYPQFGDLFIDDFPQPTYDPDTAKKLLKEAGYNGEEIQYQVRSPGYYTFETESGAAIVSMWQSIGVNAKLSPQAQADFTKAPSTTWSNSFRFPDPLGGLWLLWGPGGATKDYFTPPKEFIDAGHRLQSETDTSARRAAAQDLMQSWTDACPALLYYYPAEHWGVSDKIKWEPYASMAMDFRAGRIQFA